MTEDHVIPKSWYPDTTPKVLEKWKVPCCLGCNGRFSRIEGNLLGRLGLCLDPNDPRAKGIPQKALRAVQPSQGHSLRDQEERMKRRAAILRQTFQADEVPLMGVLPHFGPLSNVEYGERFLMVKIPEKDIKEFGVKIIRGLTYATEKRIIDRHYQIQVFVVNERSCPEVDALLEIHGVQENIGTGIETKRAISPRPPVGLYWIRIWGRFELYGSVRRKPPVHNSN